MDKRMIVLAISTPTNDYELYVDQRMLDQFTDSMDAVVPDKYIFISGNTRGENRFPIHFKIASENIECWSWMTV